MNQIDGSNHIETTMVPPEITSADTTTTTETETTAILTTTTKEAELTTETDVQIPDGNYSGNFL